MTPNLRPDYTPESVIICGHRSEGGRAMVSAATLTTRRIVKSLPIRDMAVWLERHGYTWVIGSHGVWTRS